MNLTPEIDSILDALAELCCQSISAGNTLDNHRVEQLISSLATNGWEQHQTSKPLWAEIKARAVRNHPEPAMHRGAELDSLTREIESIYRLRTYDTNAPQNQG